MSALSPQAEARDMQLASTLSRCEAVRTFGRFRCVSGKPSPTAWALALPSLLSKRPHCPILRAYSSVICSSPRSSSFRRAPAAGSERAR